MAASRNPSKEFRATPVKARPTYAEKLADVRWKRKRDEMLRRSNYTCCECGTPSA
jgi:5-methylcytosine-specific restriction endonuclease McrA